MRSTIRSSKEERGAAMVEFAIVAILLLTILFGIIEMGLVFKDQATIEQAAREAARALSLGDTPTVATNRAISTATTITLTSSNITLEKCTPDVNGNPTAWSAIGVSSTNSSLNNANYGDMVEAIITYNHPLITGYIFTGKTKQLKATMIMQREQTQ